MSQYIFEPNREEKELHRLRMIEAARDPFTIKILERTGIQAGWKCLELGPGAGSMLKWMGERVGASGKVLAVEKNPRYLGELSSPPYEIRTADFLTADIEGSFDLAYGRYVLIHNRKSMDFLRKIHGLLHSDGFAVLEEPDFTSAKLSMDESNPSHHRVNSAICQMFVDYDLDPAYGLRLPQLLAAAGFRLVEIIPTLHLEKGQSAIANLMAESAVVLSQAYQKTGKASAEDIRQYVANAHNPEYWSVYYSSISIIARPK